MNKIKSIDIAKGVSIIFVIFANSINYWLIIEENLKYVIGYIVIFCEILGATLFIFLYSFDTIFILEKMMGSPPERKNRNYVLKNGLAFILLGLTYNLIINLFNGLTIEFWGWNIITYLGFAQIIIYFSFKLVRWARLALGLSILFLTEILREILYFSKDANLISEVLYFIFVSPDPSFSLLPYASICFFSSIFSELIYQAKLLENKKANKNSIKSIMRYGVTFILVGLGLTFIDLYPLITLEGYNPLKYPFIDNLPILRNFSFKFIPYMPKFLLKGTPAYLLFSIGLVIIILGIILYFNEVMMKKNKIINALVLYGKYSLTLLFMQYIFLPIFLIQVNIVLFVPITFFFISLLGYIVYVWNKYGNNKMTLEWIIRKGTVIEPEDII